jgi:hypothetical protein
MLPYSGDHHIFFMQRVVLKPMSIGLFGRAPAPRLSDGVISVAGEQVENDSSEEHVLLVSTPSVPYYKTFCHF